MQMHCKTHMTLKYRTAIKNILGKTLYIDIDIDIDIDIEEYTEIA